MSDTNGASPTPIAEPAANLPWWERYSTQQVAAATFVVGLVALAFALLVELRDVILICFVAIVISTAVQPSVEWLHRRGLRYGIALPAVYTFLLASLIALGWFLLPPMVVQMSDLATRLPDMYEGLREQMRESPLVMVRRLGQALPATLMTATQSTDEAPTGMTGWLGFIAGGALTVVVTLLLSYYWVIYRRRAVQSILLMVSIDRRERAGELWNAIEEKVGAFVRGQVILCVAILLLSLAGYSLIGLPYAVIISILAGILEAVPYIGPLLTGAIAVAVGLTVSPETAVYAVVISLIIQQLESALLVPRIMGRTVGVNPVVTLLALTAFSLLFGLLGALLAIPLAAILQLALDRMLLNAPVEPTTIAGRDRMSVLLYELQELTRDVRSQVRMKEDDADPEIDQEEEELESILAGLHQLLQKEAQS